MFLEPPNEDELIAIVLDEFQDQLLSMIEKKDLLDSNLRNAESQTVSR